MAQLLGRRKRKQVSRPSSLQPMSTRKKNRKYRPHRHRQSEQYHATMSRPLIRPVSTSPSMKQYATTSIATLDRPWRSSFVIFGFHAQIRSVFKSLQKPASLESSPYDASFPKISMKTEAILPFTKTTFYSFMATKLSKPSRQILTNSNQAQLYMLLDLNL